MIILSLRPRRRPAELAALLAGGAMVIAGDGGVRSKWTKRAASDTWAASWWTMKGHFLTLACARPRYSAPAEVGTATPRTWLEAKAR
jgi:hypothetical protein